MQDSNVATITPETIQLREVSEPSTSTANMLMNPQVIQQLQNFANLMASGKCTVPQHLRGSEGDCMAIAMQSAQWGMNPFAVAQKTHLVNGTLGYEAQLVNAVIASSSAIEGRFHYEYSGDWDKQNSPDAAVRAGAILKGESDITWGEWLFIAKVSTKNSPLWKTAPKQQAAYLAVKYWARLYAPQVILGVYTNDELEGPNAIKERELNPTPATASSSLTAKLAEAPAQEPANSSMPNFEEDPGYTPVIELLEHLPACATKADLDDWKALALAWPEDAPEYSQLVKAYQNHCKELKSKALQEAS